MQAYVVFVLEGLSLLTPWPGDPTANTRHSIKYTHAQVEKIPSKHSGSYLVIPVKKKVKTKKKDLDQTRQICADAGQNLIITLHNMTRLYHHIPQFDDNI